MYRIRHGLFLIPALSGSILVVSSLTSLPCASNKPDDHSMARGNFIGSDNFDDNWVDPRKWSADFVIPGVPPYGVLTETNSRLEFSNNEGADTGVLRPWQLSFGSYVDNWEVLTDAHLSEINLPDLSHLDVGIYVFDVRGVCADPQVPVTFYWIALDQWHYGQSNREFYTGEYLDCMEVGQRANRSTLTHDASLRITFDSKVKTLTAWYDETGSGDGYQWTALDSICIDISPSDWQMDAGDVFGVMIGCSTGPGAVPAPGQAYLDNFRTASPVRRMVNSRIR